MTVICQSKTTCNYLPVYMYVHVENKISHDAAGLKVNDQLVVYATIFLAVHLKKYV